MTAFLKKYFVEIGILFLLALPPIKWLWGGYIVFGHDASFYLNHWENLISLFYAWNPIQGLGMNWPFMRGYIPMVTIEELFLRITGSFSIMQICIGVGWFFGMMMSMYILMLSVFPDKKYWVARLVSSILYGYNFFILQAWVIYERPKFSTYILLPLTIAVVHKLFVKKITIFHGFILFWLISLFFNAGGLPPLLGTTLLAIAFSILWYWILRIRKDGRRGIGWGVNVGLLFLFAYALANAYWVVPFVFFTFGNFASIVGSVGSIDGTIAWEKMVSSNASFANLFRLQGNPEWVNTVGHPYATMYIQNPLLVFLSIGVFAIILAGWMLRDMQSEPDRGTESMRILMILLSVSGIFMMAGTHAPFGKFYELAMRYIPGFAIFRSSFYKFAPITFLSVSWLFGCSFQRILDRFQWKNGVKNLIGGFVILGVVCYFFPYWTTNIFQFQPNYTTRVKVPDYASDMKHYIETNTNTQARILIMPMLDDGLIGAPLDTSVWGFYCLGPFISLSTNRSIIYNSLGGNDIILSLYDQFIHGNDEAFLKIVRLLGITHILFRTDVRLSVSFEKATPLSFWEKAINQKAFLKKKYSVGAWSLYEIEDPSINQMIFTVDKIAVGSILKENLYDLLENTPGYALVVDQQPIPATVTQKQFFQAQCMYCRENELTAFIKGIDIPAYGITSFITKYFQGRKEQALFNSLSDTDSRKIDLYIVFANRALIHWKQSNDKTYIQQWSSYMTSAEKIITALQGVNKYEYAIRLYSFVEAQKKYVHDDPGISASMDSIDKSMNEIMTYIWVTDRAAGSVKYLLNLPVDIQATFTVYHNTQEFLNWQIDGTPVSENASIVLSKGVHRIEGKIVSVSLTDIPRIFIEIHNTVAQTLHAPQIRWQQNSPVSYTIHIENATGPYVLGLNQYFDAGWKVTRKDTHVLQTTDTIGLNGIANGWYIKDPGTYDLSLYYEPQKYVNWGAIIFLSGFICISLLCIRTIRLRKK
jgi:hypothetical protein